MGLPENLWTASTKEEKEECREYFINEWIKDFCGSVSQASSFWSNSKQWRKFTTQVDGLDNTWSRARGTDKDPLQDEKVLEAWKKVHESGKDYERYKVKQKPSEKSRNNKDREKLGLIRLVKQIGENFFQDGSLDAFRNKRLLKLRLDMDLMINDLWTALQASGRNSDEFQAFYRAAVEYQLVVKQVLAGGGDDLDDAHQRLYDAVRNYLRYKLGRHEADAIIGDPTRLEKDLDGLSSEQKDEWNVWAKKKVYTAFRVLQGEFSPRGEESEEVGEKEEDATFSSDSANIEANEPIELKFDDLLSTSESQGASSTQEDSSEINDKVSENNDFRRLQSFEDLKSEASGETERRTNAIAVTHRLASEPATLHNRL